MNDKQLVQWFRALLLGLAGFLCVGTVIELWLTEHTQELLQFVPFVLCGMALAVVVTVYVHPTRTTIWTLRAAMALLLLGSLVGVYEHLTGNWEIILETKPNLATAEQLWAAVRGAAPLLAPGILVLVAVLATAATYAHPALEENVPRRASEPVRVKQQ